MPWPLRTTRPFGCSQLEALFRHQCVHRSAGDLLRTLCVLVPMQLLMAVWRVPQPGPVLLWLAGSAATGLALAVALACSPPSTQHPLLPLGALWLCSGPLLLSSLWPAHALLPSLAAIFLLYAFFLQFGRFRTMLCFILSSAQFVAMLYGDFGLAKMAAIVLAHVWAHVAGIYALSTGRKISRRAFLNARNALDGENELQTEIGRMGKLLSGALPPHIVESVQTQLGGSEVPRVFVEHFGHCSVVIARLYGLPSILAQLPVPDSARLLNEFDWRLRSLVDASGLLMVPTQAESILVLSGVPSPTPIHASAACQFGVDLLAMVHSFCAATGAQLQVRVGIGSGSLSAGIVGARRWHYDVLGMALDAAVHLEANCAVGGILLSEDCWRLLGNKFPAERVAQGAWQVSVVPPEFASSTVRPLLFPEPPRRFSLQTPQQAILRLLQQQPPRPVRTSPCAVCPPVVPTTPFTKRSKHGGAKSHGCVPQRVGSCRQLDSLLGPMPTGLGPFGLRFADSRLEAAFHAQPDRWLIPGLALCVLFLALFGLFQALAMPRMLPNLATLGLALGLMFLLLLALYVNFLESFCQFVTRTALGHAVAVLLVLAALLTCGLANTFSCPLDTFSTVCRPQQFPAVSLALWMLLTTVFIRLWALLLLPVLFASIGLFGLHLFWSHPSLYPDPIGRLDLLAGLCALAVLLFLLARRNQMQLRMDFLALVKTLEDGRQLERAEFLCDQILLNALPAHIAFNFAARTEPYAHLCPSVGLLVARLGRSGDWVGEFGFDRLNRLVCEIDQQLGKLSERRLEKVQTGHCYYTAACGVLPEMAKNVHDTPCTIGEQLATLAQLAEFIQELADSEGLDVAVGLDCGAALSTVIGGDRPRYELLGQPVTRARKLAEAASALGGACVLLSEDVFLALRPRAQFHFDERNALSVGPGLVAYSLLRTPQPAPSPPPPPPPAHQQQQKDELESPPPPPPHRPPIQVRANPLADGRALAISTSAQSLCSSELFSVDLSVETDSLELEWVTPEMVANGQYRPFPEPTTNCYKADRAGFYSELSVAESHQQLNGFGKTTAETNGSGAPKRWAKRLAKSRRSSTGANTSAFGSELSLPGGAHPLDRLNLAAKKVDRMLKEMAGIQGPDPPPECPFPREWDMTTTANSAGIRPASRAPSGGCGCLSEYENNDNDNGGSRPSLAFGSEMGSSTSRLDRLRRALLLAASRGRGVNTNGRRLGQQERGDGNEADRSCSPSMGGSSHFLPCSSRAAKARALLGARWRRSSAHSIGYEDEYELASAPLSSYSSSAVSLGWPSTSGKQQQLPSVGEHSQFAPIDADMEEIPVGTNAVMLDEHVGDGLETTGDGCCVRNQMLELSRDIRRNFGDFQLASFPDGQAKE